MDMMGRDPESLFSSETAKAEGENEKVDAALGDMKRQIGDLQAQLAIYKRRADSPAPVSAPVATAVTEPKWEESYSNPQEFVNRIIGTAKEQAKQEIRVEAQDRFAKDQRRSQVLGQAFARAAKEDNSIVAYYRNPMFLGILQQVGQGTTEQDLEDPEVVYNLIRSANTNFQAQISAIPGATFDPKKATATLRPPMEIDSDVPIVRGSPRKGDEFDERKSWTEWIDARNEHKKHCKVPPKSKGETRKS